MSTAMSRLRTVSGRTWLGILAAGSAAMAAGVALQTSYAPFAHLPTCLVADPGADPTALGIAGRCLWTYIAGAAAAAALVAPGRR